MRKIVFALLLSAIAASAQQTYSRLTIIPQGDGSAGVFGLRETGGGTDIFGIEVGGAMTASYTIRTPVDPPVVGNSLIVDSEPETGKFQLAWGAGGGGSGCTPAGAAGEVLFGNGAGACSDDPNFFWDDTGKRLGLGTNTPDATSRLHLLSTGSVALTVQSGDAGQAEIRLRQTTGFSGWSLYKPPSSQDFRLWNGIDRWTIDSSGNVTMNNNTGLHWKDTGGTAKRLARLETNNNFELGFFGQNVAGGDVSIWATGASGSPIGVHLDWTSTANGSFGPDAGSTVQLGTSGRPWRSGRVNGVWYIGDNGAINPQLIIEGIGGSGTTTFTRADGGGSVNAQWPNKDNSGALTSNGTGQLSWSADSGIVLIGTPGSINGSLVLASGTAFGAGTIRGAALTAQPDVEFSLNTNAAIYPGASNVNDNGLATRRWRRLYVGTAVNAPNGSDGFDGSCGPSTTLTVSGGIITGCS